MVRSRAQRGVSNHGAALVLRDGAEFTIGPRFARTRWRSPQDEGGIISLSRRSVDYFKRAAKARRVPYQRMIRALVDAYAEKPAGKR